MFALHLVHKMHPDAIDEMEWDFFIGSLAPDPGATAPRDFPRWAPRDRVPMFRLFKESFGDTFRALNLEDEAWSTWSQRRKACWTPARRHDAHYFPSSRTRPDLILERAGTQPRRPDNGPGPSPGPSGMTARADRAVTRSLRDRVSVRESALSHCFRDKFTDHIES